MLEGGHSVSAEKSHVDHVRKRRTCLLSEFLARLVGCALGAGEGLLHGCGVPVFFSVGLWRVGDRGRSEIDDCCAAACDYNSLHLRRELLHGFQNLSSAFDSRV